MEKLTRYTAYELVNIPERSIVTIPAPGWEVVTIADLAPLLALVQEVLEVYDQTSGKLQLESVMGRLAKIMKGV